MYRLLFLILVFCSCSHAGVGLDKAFESLGMRSNSTRPGIYNSQASGYYGGGGLEVRYPNHVFRPFHMTLPSYQIENCNASMSFGGLDIFKGGEMVKSLKAIATGFSSYGFMLAIDVLSPQIGNNIRWLKKTQNFLNSMSIDGCRAGMELAQGMAMKNDSLERHICTRYQSGKSGSYGGLGSAAGHCGRKRNEQRGAIANAKKSVAGMKDVFIGDFNVAWMAIEKHPYLKGMPLELKFFFMSLTGTLVSNNGKQTYFPSQMKKLIAPMMNGGGMDGLLACADKEKCLGVQSGALFVIDKKESLVGMAEKMLLHIANTALDEGEKAEIKKIKAFVDSSNLPILKMIYVNVALERGSKFLNTSAYAETIAYDILFTYLAGIIGDISESVAALKKVQFGEGVIKRFEEGLLQVKDDVARERADLYRRAQTRFKFVEETQHKEKTLGSMTNWEI